MGWSPTPEEAEAAKLIAGSWAGATLAALWKRGVSFVERAGWHIGSIGAGLSVGGYVSKEYELPVEMAGFLVGLLGVTLAFRALRAAEKFDMGEALKLIFGGRK